MRVSGLKWCILFLFCGIFQFDIQAQDSLFYAKYRVEFNQIRLDSALRLLEKKTHLHFTYNAAFASTERIVDAKFNAVPLSVILDSLFQNPFLDYRIVQSQLVVVDQRKVRQVNGDSTARDILSMAGKVVDAHTGRPLAYCSVSLKGKSMGVITNKEGFFVFRIPKSMRKDTILISHLGYLIKSIPCDEISTVQRIGLNEKVISLPEILIRTAYAKDLVIKSLKQIKNNYDRNAYAMSAFYRETVKRNKKYQSYTEALLQIYKRARRPGLFGDQISLFKDRKYTAVRVGDSLKVKLKGGLAAILQLDVIRNKPSFLRYQFLDDYQYEIQNMTLLDGRLVYVVRFIPKKDIRKDLFQGELFIDLKNFAIVQVHFSYPRKSLKMMKNNFIVKSSGKMQSYPVRVEYTVRYQKVAHKYYIKYILGKLVFKTKVRRWERSFNHRISFEMIRTDLNNQHPLPIHTDKRLKVNHIFSDMVPQYDVGYWGNANIIVPESDITKALRSFIAKSDVRD